MPTSNNQRRIKILEYVWQRQRANQNTTKATVMRYMKEQRLASGETTHNLIKGLIDEGKLRKEEINSQVHFLTIGEEFDFIKMQNELLKTSIEKALKLFGNLSTGNKINIKVIRRPNSNEYYTSVEAYEGVTKEEIDSAIKKAVREQRELEEKDMKKTTTKPHKKSLI